MVIQGIEAEAILHSISLSRDSSRKLVGVSAIGSGDQLLVETELVNQDQAYAHAVHNPVIGSLVTSYGRKVLYEGLLKCGKRAMYCDTDSIIYISDPKKVANEPFIDPQALLGSWVNELKKDQFISVSFTPSFMQMGPDQIYSNIMEIICSGRRVAKFASCNYRNLWQLLQNATNISSARRQTNMGSQWPLRPV
jgi:hypothetical protein